MASQGYSLVRGRAMRATRLDGCGNPVLGPDSVVSTKGFISVGLTANTVTGTAISVTNANGDECISDTPSPKFQNYGVEVAFCGVDPELISMMTGQAKVMDADGTLAVGFRVNSKVELADQGFALELWSGVPSAVCGDTGQKSYGYLLLPFIQAGVLGDFTVQNDAVNFTMTGAVTKDGASWGVGPYNVVPNASGVPSPLLETLDADDHLHVQLTSVPPPSTGVGATALGVAATGAVAGSPGHFTPANSYAAANLAGLTGTTASPTTAWTTGQYVTLRDGTTAHWNGSNWVAGAA